MARGDYLGEFEMVVLLGLARIHGDAYGATVFEEIQRVTGRDVTMPAVYVTLNRLEKKQLVSSRMGGPDQSDTRIKKFYRLTKKGQQALTASQSMLERLAKGVRFGTAT